jgi:DNA polymerase III gamma/tau subunit
LDELTELLQRIAVEQAVPGAESADEPGHADVRRLASALPADETQLLYSIVLHGRADLAVSPDEYSGLVMVLLRVLAFAPKADRGGDRSDATSNPPGATKPQESAASRKGENGLDSGRGTLYDNRIGVITAHSGASCRRCGVGVVGAIWRRHR